METSLSASLSEGHLKVISALVSGDFALDLLTLFIGILSYIFTFYSVFCILVSFIGVNISMSFLPTTSN